MQRQRRAYLFAIGAVLLWSTVASAFKLSLRYLEPLQLLCYASVVSLLLLATMVLARGDGARALLPADRGEAWRSLLLGALNPLLYYALLFAAYARLPAQEAQLLNYTWAVTLTLLSVPLLGHRVTGRDAAAIGASYAGVVIIATRGALFELSFADPTGVALALASTVVWALYWLLGARDRREPVQALTHTFVFGAPLTVAAAARWSRLTVAHPLGLAGAAYVGLFEMGVAFVLWLRALKETDSAARVSNLIFVSPLISLVLIHYVVGEVIHRSTLLGLVLIIGGNVLQHLGRGSTRR